MISLVVVNYRSMQEVHLDKHVKLVDSPGIVMDGGNSDSAVILRNCVKVHLTFTYLIHFQDGLGRFATCS